MIQKRRISRKGRQKIWPSKVKPIFFVVLLLDGNIVNAMTPFLEDTVLDNSSNYGQQRSAKSRGEICPHDCSVDEANCMRREVVAGLVSPTRMTGS